MLARFLDPF